MTDLSPFRQACLEAERYARHVQESPANAGVSAAFRAALARLEDALKGVRG